MTSNMNKMRESSSEERQGKRCRTFLVTFKDDKWKVEQIDKFFQHFSYYSDDEAKIGFIVNAKNKKEALKIAINQTASLLIKYREEINMAEAKKIFYRLAYNYKTPWEGNENGNE